MNGLPFLNIKSNVPSTSFRPFVVPSKSPISLLIFHLLILPVAKVCVRIPHVASRFVSFSCGAYFCFEYSIAFCVRLTLPHYEMSCIISRITFCLKGHFNIDTATPDFFGSMFANYINFYPIVLCPYALTASIVNRIHNSHFLKSIQHSEYLHLMRLCKC